MQSKINKFGTIYPEAGVEIVDNRKSHVNFLIHNNQQFLKYIETPEKYMKTCAVCHLYQFVPCIKKLTDNSDRKPKLNDYKLFLACKYCPKQNKDIHVPMWMSLGN